MFLTEQCPILLRGWDFFIATGRLVTSKTKDVTTTGICIALAVAAGYALLQIPNVELITTISFLAGLFLGSARGLLVGSLSMLIFSLFNPLGVPFIPVLMAQVVFMGLAGFTGGLWKPGIRRSKPHLLTIAGLAGTGLLLTLLYDVGTNAGFALSAGLMAQIVQIVGAGIAFSVIHLVTNTLFFATLVPAVIAAMKTDTAHPLLPGPRKANSNHHSDKENNDHEV